MAFHEVLKVQSAKKRIKKRQKLGFAMLAFKFCVRLNFPARRPCALAHGGKVQAAVNHPAPELDLASSAMHSARTWGGVLNEVHL